MLGKLFKYDFKSVSRYMLPLYAVLLVTTCGMKLTLELSDNVVVSVFRTLFIVAYVISLIAIAVGSVLILILRFYRNLMTDEGYLSFTLPVTPTMHLTSKLLNGFVWSVLTVIAVILSVLLLFAGHIGVTEFRSLWDAFQSILTMLHQSGVSNAWLVFYTAFVILGAGFGFQLIVYFCISAGQLFTSHRVLGAFIFYFIYYVVNQLGSLVLLLFHQELFQQLNASTGMNAFLSRYMTNAAVLAIVEYVVMFFLTKWLLNRKLNLE